MIPVSPNSPDKLMERAIGDSAQVLPSVSRDGILSGAFGSSTVRSTFLPPRGTRQREHELRNLYFMDEVGLVSSAFVGVAKTIAALPWEITGDDAEDDTYARMASARGWRLPRHNGIEYFQELFRQANFGGGWGELITQMVLDFLRYDAGGYLEVIAAGEVYDRPVTPLTGLAHLDPLKCYPTGDPRYPCVYYDRWGGIHVLHHNRVIRMVDMLDGDETRPGYGQSALSRAMPVVMRQINTVRYINTRMDDQPSPGFTAIGGIMKTEWEIEQQKYRARQSTDAPQTYGRRQFYFSADVATMPAVANYDFSAAPELFNFREYTDIDVDILAAAIGIDRLDIMQMSGGRALGSEGQSEILERKGDQSTIGYLLQNTERRLNDILPDGFTFGFKQRNSRQSIEDAQEAKHWADVSTATADILSAGERRTMLASSVPSIQEAIDNAPTANDVSNQPMVASDDTAGATQIGAPAEASPPQLEANAAPAETPAVNPFARKDYAGTEFMFVQDVRDLLLSAATPNPYLDRRAFGVTMRSLMKNAGLQAYKDGMAQGGVYVNDLDSDDELTYMRTYMAQAQYINGLADDVFVKKAVTPANAANRAQMWGKSLQEFNNAGIMSANANGMFEWRLGATEEHCSTCTRMNGQVHRFKTYQKRGIMPKSSKLQCKGFRCLCSLNRTTEMARGRF